MAGLSPESTLAQIGGTPAYITCSCDTLNTIVHTSCDTLHLKLEPSPKATIEKSERKVAMVYPTRPFIRIALFALGILYAIGQSPWCTRRTLIDHIALKDVLVLLIDIQIGLLAPFYLLSIVDHEWQLSLGSFPHAYQPVHNLGRRGFDLQLVLYETFHRSTTAKVVHGIVIPIQQFCWLYLVARTTSTAAQLALGIVLVVQAVSYKDVPLGLTCMGINACFYILGAYCRSAYPAGFGTDDIKIVLFLATLFEMLSHSEEPLPPAIEGSKAFGELATKSYSSSPALVAQLAMIGLTSELAAGVPGRLFNVAVYKGMYRLGYAGRGVMDVGEAKERGREILAGGWEADELTKGL